MFSKHCFFLDNSLAIWSCSRLNPVIFASLEILMKSWFNFFLITWYWFGPHCFEGRTRAVRSSAVFEYRLPTLKLSFLIMFFFIFHSPRCCFLILILSVTSITPKMGRATTVQPVIRYPITWVQAYDTVA